MWRASHAVLFRVRSTSATGASANKLALGWLGKALHAQALKDTPFRVYGVFSVGGFRALANSVRPIKEPNDLKGIKIRVTKSPVEFTLIKSWGGAPTVEASPPRPAKERPS